VARDILLQNATLAPDSVPEGFTPAQALAMASLLAGKTVTAASRAAGVSRSTVHRWLSDDPEFMAYYGQARREMSDAVEQGLRLLSASAVSTIRVLLTRRRVSDSVKLRAAVEVLSLTSKPVAGPTDVEGARNAISMRERDAGLARLRAGRRG
jgi:hypothetical protein